MKILLIIWFIGLIVFLLFFIGLSKSVKEKEELLYKTKTDTKKEYIHD